jgi:hypothetical protein
MKNVVHLPTPPQKGGWKLVLHLLEQQVKEVETLVCNHTEI